MRSYPIAFSVASAFLLFASASYGQRFELGTDSLPQPGVPKGKLVEYTWSKSAVFPGTSRKFWVYLPAQYDEAKPACVMVFQDGWAYADPDGDVRVPTVFDNLIHKNEMPVTIGIFIGPGKRTEFPESGNSDATIVPSIAGESITVDGFTWRFNADGTAQVSRGADAKGFGARYEQNGHWISVTIGSNEHAAFYDGEVFEFDTASDQRSIEYDSLGDRYARFLLDEIIPTVAESYNLAEDAADRAICGMSSGGICAFTVAWERPDAFSKVVSHVGSFTNIRGGDVYPNLIRESAGNAKPIRVFLQAGENDLNLRQGDWKLANLRIASALEFAKYDYRIEMGPGGHNLDHAGAILPDTLRWIWRDYPGVKPSQLRVDGAREARESASTGFLSMTTSNGERGQPAVVYVPKNYDPRQEWPLIVSLHGGSGRGDDGWSHLVEGLGEQILAHPDRFPCLVFFPQCPEGWSWSTWPDRPLPEASAFVTDGIEQITKMYNIDESRISLTGFSMGGFGTFLYGAQYIERFSALMPICGGGPLEDAQRLAKLPIRVYHGADDKTIAPSMSREMVAAIQAAGGEATYSELPNTDHNAWDKTYESPENISWLLSQRRPDD